MTAPLIVCAGGGTGGHVFPLLAVADALRAARSDIQILFVGTSRGIEKRVVPERGYALELLSVLPLRGAGLLGAMRGVVHAALALPAARKLLLSRRPQAVLSIGGYAAGPVSLAARSLGIPLSLIEPNADIGLSNRLIAPFVSRAYTAFPEAARHFRAGRVLETGVPIRRGFAAVDSKRRDDTLSVLVLGGSQGARGLNETVPRALALYAGPVQVLHQAGPTKERETRATYAALALTERVRVEAFLDDVPAALAAADLVIGRAGASTVAEICAVGRASLLLPYPFAGDHQRHNAQSLAKRGAARCVLSSDANPERLAQELERFRARPELLDQMSASARAIGRPEAAALIARDVLRGAGLLVDGPLEVREAGEASHRARFQPLSRARALARCEVA